MGADSQTLSESKTSLQLLMQRTHAAHRFCIYVNTLMVLALLTINVAGCIMVDKEMDVITTETWLADLSRREMGIVQMALNARLITAVDGRNGVYRANFDYFRGLLEETQANIWVEIAEAKSLDYQKLLTQTPTPTWQLIENSTQLVFKPLMDALQFIIDSVGFR